MTLVLVTGASGFIGVGLCRTLTRAGYRVRAAHRRDNVGALEAHEFVQSPDLGPNADWRAALMGVDAIVHLAGLAHARHDEGALQRVNVEGTRALCAAADAVGVRRFIQISSIKAVAERSDHEPLDESATPLPQDAYGRAKLAAERVVAGYAHLAPIILRSPLVFAEDAKANFAALMRWAASPWPAPFKNISNRRTLISRDALCAAIAAALQDQGAGLFHLGLRPALSSAEIISALRVGLKRRPNLVALPEFLQRALPGPLRDSLEVDDSKFRSAYNYGDADRDAREALAATARAWGAAQ